MRAVDLCRGGPQTLGRVVEGMELSTWTATMPMPLLVFLQRKKPPIPPSSSSYPSLPPSHVHISLIPPWSRKNPLCNSFIPSHVRRGTVQPDYGQRRVQLNFGKRNVYLGLHQPLYKDIDTGTAKVMKLCNVSASILLIIGGFYRLMASFGGPVVLPECNADAFRNKFCPGVDPSACYLTPSSNYSIAEFERINCEWILKYARTPGDAFPNFVVAAFVLFYGIVAWLEEVTCLRAHQQAHCALSTENRCLSPV